MKILQDKNGNGFIQFTKQEIEMINKNKGIGLNAESIKRFAVHLMNLAATVAERSKFEQNIEEHVGNHIPTKD